MKKYLGFVSNRISIEPIEPYVVDSGIINFGGELPSETNEVENTTIEVDNKIRLGKCLICGEQTVGAICGDCKNAVRKMKQYGSLIDEILKSKETTYEPEELTEEQEYDEFLKRMRSPNLSYPLDKLRGLKYTQPPRFSGPLFKCDKCGAYSMCRDEQSIAASYPPKRIYVCRKEHGGCGEYTLIK